MSETQSRYGIMDELNTKKIKAKEELATLERDSDTYIYDTEKKIESQEQKIKDTEKTYASLHNDKVRELELKMKMLVSDHERKLNKYKDSLNYENDNFESDFQKWKLEQKNVVKENKENLNVYVKDTGSKIKSKKEVIDEIENGISSLKEMSQEQPTKQTE